jgi:hypothetical protein
MVCLKWRKIGGESVEELEIIDRQGENYHVMHCCMPPQVKMKHLAISRWKATTVMWYIAAKMHWQP